jgi:hypothetical protein
MIQLGSDPCCHDRRPRPRLAAAAQAGAGARFDPDYDAPAEAYIANLDRNGLQAAC